MPEIKMDYEMMQDMISAFLKGANELEDTQKQMEQIAVMLEDGGLIGKAGDSMTGALRGPLKTKIVQMQDKFEEIARDLQNAIDEMQAADSGASGNMG